MFIYSFWLIRLFNYLIWDLSWFCSALSVHVSIRHALHIENTNHVSNCELPSVCLGVSIFPYRVSQNKVYLMYTILYRTLRTKNNIDIYLYGCVTTFLRDFESFQEWQVMSSLWQISWLVITGYVQFWLFMSCYDQLLSVITGYDYIWLVWPTKTCYCHTQAPSWILS